MDKDKLEKRIKDIEEALRQSILNHNILVGQLNEANYQLSELNKEPEAKEDVPAEV